MNVKKILLISLIAVAVLASFSAVSAGLFDGLFGEEQQDNVIEIDHITFNTTNVTKFKIYNETEDDAVYHKWYIDENDTGYNIHIFNVSEYLGESNESSWDDLLKEFEEGSYGNVSSQTVNGVVVYTITADVGDHVGEQRYAAYVGNADQYTILEFSSPDLNETVKMVSTLKFK